MNNISWFLYAVDIVENIREFSIFIAVFGGSLFIAGILLKFSLLNDRKRHKRKAEEHGQKEYHKEQIVNCDIWIAKWNKVTNILKYVLPIAIIFAVFIPVNKTMYLILGSELGEDVVNSETGKRVQDAINKKLDEYLTE